MSASRCEEQRKTGLATFPQSICASGLKNIFRTKFRNAMATGLYYQCWFDQGYSFIKDETIRKK